MKQAAGSWLLASGQNTKVEVDIDPAESISGQQPVASSQ